MMNKRLQFHMSWSYLLASDNLTREQLRKFNVSELQGILNQLNLVSTGKKHELVERLFQFWKQINQGSTDEPQNETQGDQQNPTAAIRFSFTQFPDIIPFRAKLESYGPLIAMLLDPEESKCYVIYRSQEDTQRLYDDIIKLGFGEPHFILESEVEKKSKEFQLLPDNAQLHNAAQKTFRKTVCEPKLYWCHRNQSDDEEEDEE